MSRPAAVPAAVLWDLDGTIVDTEPFWMDAQHRMVDRHGGRWTHQHGLALVGQDLTYSAEYLRTHGNVDLPTKTIIDTLLREVIDQVGQAPPWRPGALALIAALNELGVRQALVTMSWQPLANAVIAHLPPNTFASVVTGDRVAHGKPHPEPYLTALADLGIGPRGVVVVEDSPTGLASAESAGLVTVAVPLYLPLSPRPGRWIRDSLLGLTPADLGGYGLA